MQSRLHVPQQQPLRREVIRLESGRLGVRKSKRGDKFGQDVYLLDQIIAELFLTPGRRRPQIPLSSLSCTPLMPAAIS
jgi:hypothetical protein